MPRKHKITHARADWLSILHYMETVSDPYCQRSWLRSVLESDLSPTLTLPAYGCGAIFLDYAYQEINQ